jgi:hypothetical protein
MCFRWVRPQASLRIIPTHEQLINVKQATQSQLTKHGQSFAANLASPKTMIEQVLNDDHAMVKFEKSFQIKE